MINKQKNKKYKNKIYKIKKRHTTTFKGERRVRLGTKVLRGREAGDDTEFEDEDVEGNGSANEAILLYVCVDIHCVYVCAERERGERERERMEVEF